MLESGRPASTRTRTVDLVLVSGDVFDRPVPPVDALALGSLQADPGLRRASRRWSRSPGTTTPPSCSTRSRRWSAELERGVHVVGAPGPHDRRRDRRNNRCEACAAARRVLPVPARGPIRLDGARPASGTAPTPSVSAGSGSRRATGRARSADAVHVLTPHFMVGGARVGGPSASPRGRGLGGDRASDSRQPAVRRARPHPRRSRCSARSVPAHYAGVAPALDFGEAGEDKEVVIVDAEPGQLATVRSGADGERAALVRGTGTWDELEGRAEGWASLRRPHGPRRGRDHRAGGPRRRTVPFW